MKWAIALIFLSNMLQIALAEQRGIASIYDRSSGSKVACGGKLNEQALTAAHRSLPCGTRIRVRNLSSGREVVVVVNDRGPFVQGRVVDLTPAAAQAIGLSRGQGLARVVIDPEQ
jgi:rare lipoprotein A